MSKCHGVNLLSLLGASVLLVSTSGAAFAFDQCDILSVTAAFDVPVNIIMQHSIDDIEAQEMREILVDGKEIKIPFGLLNEQWETFKSMYKQGDCVVFFRTGPETWDDLFGREGYILVRGDQPIHALVTKLN